MSDFGTVRALIKRDIQRSDLSTDSNANIDDDTISFYIKAAIDYYSSTMFWFNQKTDTSVAITASQEYATPPTDFVAPILWRITTQGYQRIVEPKSINEIEGYRSSVTSVAASAPYFYALFQKRFEMYPTPTATLATSLSYIYKLPELVDDSDTNEWVDECRLLIANKAQEMIYKSRLHHYERGEMHAGLAAKEYDRLNDRTVKANSTGSARIVSYL